MKFCRYIILIIIIVLPLFIFAAKKTITPEDVVNITLVSNPQISPDGSLTAFEVKDPAADSALKAYRNSDIWIAPSDGSFPAKKLISGPNNEYAPLWSTDGKYLAFISNRGKNGTDQVYYFQDLNRGPVQLTKIPGGITGFKWFKNSHKIAYTSMTPIETTDSKKPLSDSYEPGKQSYMSRLYVMHLNDTAAVQISADTDNINDFDISPDGTQAAVCLSASPAWEDMAYHSKLAVYGIQSRQRKVLANIEGDLIMSIGMGNVRWSPDGKNILYFERYGSVYTMLPAVISADGSGKKILAKDYKGTIWEMEWLLNNSILVSSQQGMHGILGRLDIGSGSIEKITDIGICWGWPKNSSINRSGDLIAFKDADYNSAEDIWIITSSGTNRKQLTNFNPQTADLAFGEEEIIRWKSSDGSEIEGLLIKPKDYHDDKKYPLVTVIHGGPEWAWWSGWHLSWHEWGQMLASNGYAVLLPNPRGSDGYGWKFVEKSKNDWGGGDYQDIMNGIDYVIGKGIADLQKLGIGGWSYGAYLTAWSITQDNRFKAAVCGAGIYNLFGFYGICPAQPVFEAYFGGSAYECKNAYDKVSPLTYVSNVKTPVLLLHGENDFGVAASQAKEFYSGLKKSGVECKLFIYPEEGHGFRERNRQMDSLQKIIDWFDRYLKTAD